MVAQASIIDVWRFVICFVSGSGGIEFSKHSKRLQLSLLEKVSFLEHDVISDYDTFIQIVSNDVISVISLSFRCFSVFVSFLAHFS